MSAPDRSSGEAAVPEHRIHHGGHDRFTLELEVSCTMGDPNHTSEARRPDRAFCPITWLARDRHHLRRYLAQSS